MEAGTTFSQYRVLEKIGAGGMGEVWLAEDTQLQRRVALKVLTGSGTTQDRVLQQRFEREARTLAAMNHPNIVTLYGVESDNAALVLAMEWVEGTRLTRLLRTPMPIDKFLPLAMQLTDAVATAHDQGILHRDLKPDNVMITAEGIVKVLDFGLAKLRASADGDGDLTEMQDHSSGTVAYMSPEQAERKPLEPSSDVFSLGILLYQMATGKYPFTGDSSLALLSSILKDEPARATTLQPSLPPHLGRIIQRCLQKDKNRRYKTAREVCSELTFLQEELHAGDYAAARPAVRGRRMAILPVLMFGLGLGVALVAALMWLRPAAQPTVQPQFLQQTFSQGVETHPSISPDGEMVVYTAAAAATGNTDIYLQRVVGQNRINLTEDSEANESGPAFSPDGAHIAFRSERGGGGIFLMGATGESVRRLTDFGYDPAWSPDGQRLVFATEEVNTPYARYTQSQLWTVDINGGEPQRIFDGDAVQPSWSPDGQRIAFWSSRLEGNRAGQRDIATIRPDGSGLASVTQDLAVDWCPVWHPTDNTLLYCSDRHGSMNLWQLTIDTATGAPGATPRALTMATLWAGPFSIDATGKQIAYAAQETRSTLRSVALDPSSGALAGEPRTLTAGTLIVWMFQPSPDGEWIAFTNEGTQEDVYLVRRDGSGLRRLTEDLHKDRGVSWWDNDRLLFYSSRTGGYEIWSIRTDGSDLHQVTRTEGPALWLPRVSPDGTRMLAHNSQGSRIFELERPRMPLQTEEATSIGRIGDAGKAGVFASHFWSPDGNRILGLEGVPPASTAVVYDTRDQSFASFELPEHEDVMPIGWLPGGRRFLLRASGAVWSVDAQTGEFSKLPLHIGAGLASISQDGNELFYVERSTQADIWVAQFD